MGSELPPALAPFDNLRVWSRGEQRAPHKPLLALLALGRLSRGDAAPLPYAEVDEALRKLLKDFGPGRQSYHPEYPFWRLQTDGIWQVEADEQLRARVSNTDPPKSELLAHNARGQFTPEVLEAFRREPALMDVVVSHLLEAHFTESYEEDLLSAVGYSFTNADGDRVAVTRRPRDPSFRPRILSAYEDRCTVCDYDLRLDASVIGLEAAHIRWHHAGGPDEERNGLALCTLHHKIFDRGGFTMEQDGTVLVSDRIRGERLLEDVLLRFHGKTARPPQHPEHRPAGEHLEWHRREVFQGRPRSR